MPPLAVVGLLLGVGRYADAAQALLLFGTNVAAIVLTGTLLLRFYRVRDAAVAAGRQATDFGRKTLAIVVALVILVAIPLGIGSLTSRGPADRDQGATGRLGLGRQVGLAGRDRGGRQPDDRRHRPRPAAGGEVDDLRQELNAAGLPANDLLDPPRRRRHPLLRTRRHRPASPAPASPPDPSTRDHDDVEVVLVTHRHGGLAVLC